MKKKPIVLTNKLNTQYVFSANNRVYLKRHSTIKSRNANTIHPKEWVLINFQWQS